MCVVDGAEEGLFCGGLGDQAEDGEADEERVWGCAGAEAEGDGERVVLGRGEALVQLEDG